MDQAEDRDEKIDEEIVEGSDVRKQRERKTELRSLFEELESPEHGIPEETLLDEMEEREFDRENVEELLQEWLKKGFLYEPVSDKYSVTLE